MTVSHTSCRAAWNHCRGFVSRDGCVRAATASPDRRARGTEYSSIPCWRHSSAWSLQFCFFATRPVGRPPVEATTMDEPTCYDATSGPGTRRRVCPSARSPTGGPARGRGPGGAAVASSGDNAFVLRGRGRPARLVGAYSVATPAAGRTTVHEGPRRAARPVRLPDDVRVPEREARSLLPGVRQSLISAHLPMRSRTGN